MHRAQEVRLKTMTMRCPTPQRPYTPPLHIQRGCCGKVLAANQDGTPGLKQESQAGAATTMGAWGVGLGVGVGSRKLGLAVWVQRKPPQEKGHEEGCRALHHRPRLCPSGVTQRHKASRGDAARVCVHLCVRGLGLWDGSMAWHMRTAHVL